MQNKIHFKNTKDQIYKYLIKKNFKASQKKKEHNNKYF